jgi:hypothetical protein
MPAPNLPLKVRLYREDLEHRLEAAEDALRRSEINASHTVPVDNRQSEENQILRDQVSTLLVEVDRLRTALVEVEAAPPPAYQGQPDVV